MISIIIDSTAYLTRREAQELGVTVLPAVFYTPEKVFEEGFIEENDDFEEVLARGGCRTCHISSRLSGTYSSACLAASQLNSPDIAIVDSLTTAGGLFSLVKAARRLAGEGRGLWEIARELERMRERVSIAFSVDDMGPLRRSGRLGVVRQSVGTILNLRPILLLKNGTVHAQGTARGGAGQIEEIIKAIPQDAEEIFIHYISNHFQAVRLYLQLKEKMYTAKISHRKLGPVLGVHLGLGVIGATWIK
jgi:DegV family protein with EDD domain